MTERISIVIPTRHRAHTLGDTLQSCVDQQETGDYEILVSDNQSCDGTAELVAGFKNPRIRYVLTPEVLSMEANWEFALSHVSEGHVMIIGADDALVPGAIQTLRKVLTESGAKAVRPPLISYHWHNFPRDDQAQIARGVPVDDDRWWWEDSQAQLKTCAEALLKHQYFFEVLPTIYHGTVHTSVLEEARRRNGAVFLSKMPDMFTAVLVAAALPRYARMNTPVSLNAMSCSSNAVAQWLGGHEKDKEMRRFWAEVDHPYEPELVKDSASPDITFALPVLIADQYLKLQKRGWNVPVIPVERVFEATMRGARRWRERNQYDSAVRVGQGMAAQHGWEARAEALLAQNPFQARTEESQRPRTLFDPAKNSYRYLDLRGQEAEGGWSAGRLIASLRTTHRKQQETLRAAPTLRRRESAHMARWDLSTWCLWALIRQESLHLTGRGVVIAGEDAVLRRHLLSPPSRAAAVRFDSQAGAEDEFVVLPPGATHPEICLPRHALVLTLHRSSDILLPPVPGLHLRSESPLLCTVEENLALALAAWQDVLPEQGWKRRAVALVLAPVWHSLCARLPEESSRPPAPGGWVVTRWSVLSPS